MVEIIKKSYNIEMYLQKKKTEKLTTKINKENIQYCTIIFSCCNQKLALNKKQKSQYQLILEISI